MVLEYAQENSGIMGPSVYMESRLCACCPVDYLWFVKVSKTNIIASYIEKPDKRTETFSQNSLQAIGHYIDGTIGWISLGVLEVHDFEMGLICDSFPDTIPEPEKMLKSTWTGSTIHVVPFLWNEVVCLRSHTLFRSFHCMTHCTQLDGQTRIYPKTRGRCCFVWTVWQSKETGD